MDRRERIDDPTVALEAALEGWQQKIWTAMPGIVESFDNVAITVSVQPSVQVQLRNPSTGVWSNVTLPLCVDVPVKFLWCSLGGFTVPIKPNDEGLIVFGSRCIDSWWQSGGVQPQAEFRAHNLSDGFFLPGVTSQPNKIANFNDSFPEMRNVDGSVKLALVSGGFELTGNLNVTGAISQGAGGTLVTLGEHIHAANNTPPTPGH